MRAIGSGIQNVLFADVRTADDARACVRSVRPEHPDHGGLHGVGMRRDVRTVLYGGSEEWTKALCDCVIVLMIEKREAVENLEAILGVRGVDMIQFGPGDYALSLGFPGRRAHDGVREAEAHVIETAQRLDVAVRAEPRNAAEAERYLELGVRHFCVGHDVLTLHDWFTEQGALMREALSAIRLR